MPLFKSNRKPQQQVPPQQAPPAQVDDVRRSDSISSRSSGSIWRAHQDPAAYNAVTVPPPRQSYFNRYPSPEDPAIADARARVSAAERAEQDADDALTQARMSVRDAMDHVRALEREAAEDARVAQLKQSQARNISDRARPLGRHGPYV